MLSTALLCAALASAPTDLSESRVHLPPDYVIQAGVAAGAGMLGVPAALFAAKLVGTLSNQLIFALVPSLLVLGFLPAAIVSITSWLMRDRMRGDDEARPRFVGPFLVTVLINVAVMVVGGFLGVSLANASAVVALSLIDAVSMAIGNVGVMRALQPAQPPAAASTPAAQALAPWAAVSTVSF